MVLSSFHLAGTDLKVGGALASKAGSYTFARITAWGQTSTHLPHWMQRFSSHTGMSSAMLRFSHCAVAVGKVPSLGMALTGRESPSPSMILASTSRTKAGAWEGTAGRRSKLLLTSAGI